MFINFCIARPKYCFILCTPAVLTVVIKRTCYVTGINFTVRVSGEGIAIGRDRPSISVYFLSVEPTHLRQWYTACVRVITGYRKSKSKVNDKKYVGCDVTAEEYWYWLVAVVVGCVFVVTSSAACLRPWPAAAANSSACRRGNVV